MSKVFFTFLIFLASCFSSTPTTTHFKGCAMTMNYHIVIGKKLSRKKQKELSLEIDKIFAQTDRIYNNWNPSSEISQINQNQSKLSNVISKQLRALLLCCDKCYKITKKRFDPTIGSIFNTWKTSLTKHQLPGKPANNAVGWQKIVLNELSLQKKHPKCQFDLCGISKGYTIDLIAEKISKLGYKDFFVEWGGEIFAKGHHPEKRKWSVLINSTNSNSVIHLKDKAIATSGCSMLYEWKIDDKSYFHIFDPQSKKPLEKSEISTVIVIADKCYLADAVATAAMTFTSFKELKEWGYEIIENSSHISSIIIKLKDNTIERIANERGHFF